MNKWKEAFFVSSLILALVALSFLATACKGKEAEESQAKAVIEDINLETLKPILGEAREDNSGLIDVTGDSQETIIAYRYYDADRQNYDDGLVQDLAPKIEKLYQTFKTLDRVIFQVSVNDPQVTGQWKPYVSFTVNRELVKKIEWTNILTGDFFRNMIDVKRFD